MVELVTVLVILGVLAALAGPRFFTKTEFDDRGYYEEALSAIRYAQKHAIVTGCDIRVEFTAGGYNLQQWINAGSCVADPGGAGLTPVIKPTGGNFSGPPPSGVTVGAGLFFFDRIGRPSLATGVNFGDLITAPITIAVGTRTITVEDQTGFTR